MRSGPPVCCHTSAVSFLPTAPCYAHKGRIYATRCRTQGLDSAVVCRAVFPYSRPCVRHQGGKAAKEGRGAEPRGKERLGFQGTAPAPHPHTFGYTRGLPGGQPATRLSLGGRRSAAAPLPPPAPLGPGGGAPTGGGAPGWSKMRLSLGLFRGIPGWLFQNASESRRNHGNRPETVELRRKMEHRAPAPPKHGETQTHFGPLRHPDSNPPHHRDGEGRNGPAARERVLRLPQTYSARSAAPRGRTGSMREGRARHLREPAAPARVVPGGALDPDAVARHCCPRARVVPGLTGSAPGWAVGAHMCGRKRMARRTSARGATFMAAIAAL